jgi:hypothetical protein
VIDLLVCTWIFDFLIDSQDPRKALNSELQSSKTVLGLGRPAVPPRCHNPHYVLELLNKRPSNQYHIDIQKSLLICGLGIQACYFRYQGLRGQSMSVKHVSRAQYTLVSKPGYKMH